MKKSKLSIVGPSLKLALASQSPRRRDLLAKAGYEFTVLQCKVSEIFDETLNPRDVPVVLAERKARAALTQHNSLNEPGNLILAADTLVFLDDEILGKPRDISEATEFLRRLRGRTHHVITGMTLLKSGSTEVWTGSSTSAVTFHNLPDDDIAAYVATGEPMDKAGAYGMQGEGKKFVAKLAGSWSNVVGLCLEDFERALVEARWTVERRTP